VLRTIDRFLAPVTWVAAAFTALALLVGPSLIGAKKEKAAVGEPVAPGRQLFASNCGGCHTLARAGTGGTSGPNLDDPPDTATVALTVRSGRGAMPSFEETLSRAEIGAVAAFVAGEEPAAEATPTATAPAEEDETGDVTSIPTEDGPDGIAVSGGRVWVALASSAALQQFDASSGDAVGEPLEVGRQPDNPAVAGDVVWLVLSGDDAVARVENGQITRIPVGDAPEDLAIAGDTVWVANAGDGTVSRIDRASATVTGEPIQVGPKPLGIAAGGGTVWVTSNEDDTVWRLDAATGEVRGEPIPVGARPRGVAVGGGSAWVANSGDDTVTRVRDGLAVPVGANPRDLAVAGGTVWVANAADDTVSRIDAASGEVDGDPIDVGDDPIGIAVGDDAVWVTGFRDDTLARIPQG
jgi:DNA-binding beta-propeller fold protein YncE